jgi:hypothetical protein
MKIDLAGPRRRGLAMGLNEAAGYGAVALTAYLTGLLAARAGLRPEPFFLGLAYAGLGLGLSALPVRETRGHAQLEADLAEPNRATDVRLSAREVFVLTSLRERALSACSQAGLVNNAGDGLAWGLLPLLFARGGLSVARIGVLAALYPAVWGLSQLGTGPLSDRLGRKPLIVGGMLLQAVALAGTALAGSFPPWPAASRPGRPAPCSLAPAPRWSTRPCWPPSATSPTPPGGPPRSGSTACGVTPASPSARYWPAWSPTSPACGPRSGWSPRSPPPPAWSSRCACKRPIRRRGGHDRRAGSAAAAVCDLPGPQPAARLPVPFYEHVRVEDPRLAHWQNWLQRPWGWLAGGCHPNRDTVAAITAAGLEVVRLDRFDH